MPTITGKKIGATGYGLMNLTWRATPIPDAQAFAAMKAALNSGCNCWNAGELYGTPESNSLHLLNRYFTKYPKDADMVVLSIKGGMIPGAMAPDGSEKNIRRSVDECLKVLDGKKFLDVFEAARFDPKVPLETTMGALAQCVKEGKIGGISLSEVDADTIRKCAKIHHIEAVEVELNLHTPDILTNGVASTCGELKIPIIAYSPLGRGLLTAQMNKPEDLAADDIRHWLPRFAPGAMEKNAEVAKELEELAKAHGCTPAQIALAWVRSWSGKDGFSEIVPIPGSTTAERAEENAKEVTLSEHDLEEIKGIMQKNEVVGARYPGGH